MRIQTSISVILESRYNLSSEKQSVRLRVTNNRNSNYYSLKIYLTPEEFKLAISDKPGKKLSGVRKEIEKQKLKAQDIIDELPNFSFEEFGRRFKSETGRIDFFERMNLMKDALRLEGREKYAISFDTTINSFKTFIVDPYPKTEEHALKPAELKLKAEELKLKLENIKLKFEEIDVKFLSRYEQWMTQKDRKNSTIGIYLRNVKTVFNDEIGKGHLNKELYPFGKHKYTIPSGKGVKRALTKSELKRLYDYPVEEGTLLQKQRDYWFFIYLVNGLNVKDMAMLRYGNIQDDIIVFTRAKTKNTTKGNVKSIVVPVTEEIQGIINRWGNKAASLSTFIFPILNEDLTNRQIVRRIEDAVSDINAGLKKIAAELGILKKVTTYVARHSFGSILKQAGYSTEFIQEAFGHSDVRVTEAYLGSFEIEQKQEAGVALLSFIKEDYKIESDKEVGD